MPGNGRINPSREILAMAIISSRQQNSTAGGIGGNPRCSRPVAQRTPWHGRPGAQRAPGIDLARPLPVPAASARPCAPEGHRGRAANAPLPSFAPESRYSRRRRSNGLRRDYLDYVDNSNADTLPFFLKINEDYSVGLSEMGFYTLYKIKVAKQCASENAAMMLSGGAVCG